MDIKVTKRTSSRFKSIVGGRFGMLVVTKDERGQGENPQVECECDCGQTCVKYKHHLKDSSRSKNPASCGCSSHVGRERKDITDFRSGKLVVIGNGTEALVLCRCDCDRELLLPRGGVSSGQRASCGCDRSRFVTVSGVERNISGWAEFLGVSRERARQLHNRGVLVSRIESVLEEI